MAVPNLWRTKKQRYRLQAEVCPECSMAVFPPREVCPHCHQPMSQAVGDAAGLLLPFVMQLPQPMTLVAAGDD
jgi:predicted amidophosphoribosyltransferase